MASLDSTSIFNPSLPVSTTSVVHISIPVSIKLDRTNFLTWRSQFESIIDGYGLTNHLDPVLVSPPRQINYGSQLVPNPAFTTWHMQDRLLLGWLRSTISAPVLSQHVQCQITSSLWTALHRVYLAISSAKIMELCRLLQTTTRGGQSCNDYFERMQSIADQLAVVGELVTDSDLTRYVLGSDFNSFVVAITTRFDPLSIEELHGYLLSHEALLNSQHQLTPSSESIALYASGRGRGRYSRSRGRGSFNPSPLLPTPIRGRTGPYISSGRGSYVSYNHSPGISGQIFSNQGSRQTCMSSV
jgi:gag-polypeptide of LTR copia-type